MSVRAGLRFLQGARSSARPQFQSQFRRSANRRWQATDATAAPAQSGFAKIWNSPVGPKTVHFWAPVMKWCLVLAGISDFARPADKLSLTQNLALLGTGAIWTRWCLIIKPRNILLSAVNFFLGCVGATQVTRIFLYRQSVKNKPLTEVAKEEAEDIGNTTTNAAKDGVSKAKEVAQ